MAKGMILTTHRRGDKLLPGDALVTFEFHKGWPCFQGQPLEEAEIKEAHDTIGEMRSKLYIMQRVRRWAGRYFQHPLRLYFEEGQTCREVDP